MPAALAVLDDEPVVVLRSFPDLDVISMLGYELLTF